MDRAVELIDDFSPNRYLETRSYEGFVHDHVHILRSQFNDEELGVREDYNQHLLLAVCNSEDISRAKTLHSDQRARALKDIVGSALKRATPSTPSSVSRQQQQQQHQQQHEHEQQQLTNMTAPNTASVSSSVSSSTPASASSSTSGFPFEKLTKYLRDLRDGDNLQVISWSLRVRVPGKPPTDKAGGRKMAGFFEALDTTESTLRGSNSRVPAARFANLRGEQLAFAGGKPSSQQDAYKRMLAYSCLSDNAASHVKYALRNGPSRKSGLSGKTMAALSPRGLVTAGLLTDSPIEQTAFFLLHRRADDNFTRKPKAALMGSGAPSSTTSSSSNSTAFTTSGETAAGQVAEGPSPITYQDYEAEGDFDLGHAQSSEVVSDAFIAAPTSKHTALQQFCAAVKSQLSLVHLCWQEDHLSWWTLPEVSIDGKSEARGLGG